MEPDSGAWSRSLEPPVHKTLPEEFSIRLFRENSSSRLFWKNSSSRLVDSYGRTQLMFYLKHAVPSHSSSLLTVTVRTLSYIWHSKWDMLHVTCYMQSVMCYMWLVTCYVKALLSMGKQGTKSFARDFLEQYSSFLTLGLPWPGWDIASDNKVLWHKNCVWRAIFNNIKNIQQYPSGRLICDYSGYCLQHNL